MNGVFHLFHQWHTVYVINNIHESIDMPYQWWLHFCMVNWRIRSFPIWSTACWTKNWLLWRWLGFQIEVVGRNSTDINRKCPGYLPFQTVHGLVLMCNCSEVPFAMIWLSMEMFLQLLPIWIMLMRFHHWIWIWILSILVFLGVLINISIFVSIHTIGTQYSKNYMNWKYI